MQRRSSPKIGTTDVIELVKLGNETSVDSSLVFTFRRESLRALWSRALTQKSKVNFFVLFSHNTWSPWQMPREAALKARERLRACVTEPHVEDTELEGKRPHIDEDGDYKRASSSAMSVTRRHRCGVCVGCNATNCGRCVYCLDMPQFGGTGNLRKSCIERTCVEITKKNERLAEAGTSSSPSATANALTSSAADECAGEAATASAAAASSAATASAAAPSSVATSAAAASASPR